MTLHRAHDSHVRKDASSFSIDRERIFLLRAELSMADNAGVPKAGTGTLSGKDRIGPANSIRTRGLLVKCRESTLASIRPR